MKIGIITFHWAINYGAVIQAWALQKFLESAGHQVVIIDYEHRSQPRFPLLTVLRKNKARRCREKLFKQFSRNMLRMTPRHYTPKSIDCMKNLGFDAYITGSDQIWNLEFLNLPKEGMSYSYFLDFAEENALKIAYAASLGNTGNKQLSSDTNIMGLLEKFDAVSVREAHAVDILKQCGRNDTELVPDPTILLKKHDYLNICPQNSNRRQSPYIFGYVLGEQQRCRKSLEKFSREYDLQAVNLHSDNFSKDELMSWNKIKLLCVSPDKWIKKIASAKAVITDSFHGTVISVILNRPFVVLGKMGNNAGQNERLSSFLKYIGLEERMIVEESIGRVPNILEQKIDWQAVNLKLASFRLCGEEFICKNLKDKMN
jgi:hypothetical protein